MLWWHAILVFGFDETKMKLKKNKKTKGKNDQHQCKLKCVVWCLSQCNHDYIVKWLMFLEWFLFLFFFIFGLCFLPSRHVMRYLRLISVSVRISLTDHYLFLILFFDCFFIIIFVLLPSFFSVSWNLKCESCRDCTKMNNDNKKMN